VVSLGIVSVVPPTEPCVLRSTQPLKVSTRDFSWVKGGWCIWLTTYHSCSAETSGKSGALTYTEPLGPRRPVAGHLYFYPTTPTDYPSTTRGRSVGPPVAVNIDICGYLWFWALLLSESYGYSTPLTTFLVKKDFSLHRPVLIFQWTVNCRASDNQNKECQNHISHLAKMRSY